MSLLGTRTLNGPVCHHTSVPGRGSDTLSPKSSHSAKVQAILSPCAQFTELVLPGHWGLVFICCTFPSGKSKAFHWPQLLTLPTYTCPFPMAILSWHSQVCSYMTKWSMGKYTVSNTCMVWLIRRVWRQCKQISKTILMCTKPRDRNLGICSVIN